MKRRPPLLMILLLLVAWGVAGAIVNVAVAWGCSIWSSVRYDEARIQSGDLSDVGEHCRQNAVKVRHQGKRWTFGQAGVIGAEWHQMISIDSEDAFLKRSGAYHIQLAGWPMQSMYCIGVPTTPPMLLNGNLQIGMEWQGGFACPSQLHPRNAYSYVLPQVERPLPTTPLIGGFAINTVFYALVLWLLFAFGGTPLALRRRRRIKRGLCPKCAYPVGTNERCTECGATHAREAASP